MARKEKIITLNDRGTERKFKIIEMSATQAQSWLIRAGLVLSVAANIDPDAEIGGLSIDRVLRYLVQHGIHGLAKVDYEKAKPLIDELLMCCYRVDNNLSQQCTPGTVDGFVEDVRTLLMLEKEALTLTFNFFETDSGSGSQNSEPIISIPRKS